MKSWVEISEQRLKANYRLLVQAAGGDTAVMAVIKANAYGHGADLCAPILAQAGAPWLGVADHAEAIALRNALAKAAVPPKNQPQILVMCASLGDDAHEIVRHALTPVAWEQHHLQALAAAARQQAASAEPQPFHLEIDTGMARHGIAPGEQLQTLLLWLKHQSHLRLDGVLTHFASAEIAGSPQILTQRKRFEEAVAAIAASGHQPTWIHAGNSSTLDHQGPEENIPWLRALAATVHAKPMVRSGIALYGYCLPIEHSSSATKPTQPKVRHKLKPLMTWKTRITSLRHIHAGDTVGYNATFTATKSMRLALLPVGYSDGLRRELSSSNTKLGGWVIVRGKRAPIIGRISMNLTVVDITEIPDAALNDEVTLLGDSITADDHAHLAHTISYEITCGVRATPRLVP